MSSQTALPLITGYISPDFDGHNLHYSFPGCLCAARWRQSSSISSCPTNPGGVTLMMTTLSMSSPCLGSCPSMIPPSPGTWARHPPPLLCRSCQLRATPPSGLQLVELASVSPGPWPLEWLLMLCKLETFNLKDCFSYVLISATANL